jgi:hypothetical protein
VCSRNFNSLAKVRITDTFGLGILPVDFVLNVEISIDIHKYDFLGLSSNHHYRWGWDIAPTPRTEVLYNLEHLFGFKTGTKLTINCNMDGFKQKDDEDQ